MTSHAHAKGEGPEVGPSALFMLGITQPNPLATRRIAAAGWEWRSS